MFNYKKIVELEYQLIELSGTKTVEKGIDFDSSYSDYLNLLEESFSKQKIMEDDLHKAKN